MSSRLENDLSNFEKNNPIKKDKELIAAIEFLIDKENYLPEEERDNDFIDEAVELILSVKGVDLEKLDDYSEKKAAECIDKVKKEVNSGESTQKPKPKFLRMKCMIPIVALLAMLTIGVAAQAMGFDVIGMTKKAYESLVMKITHTNGNTDIIVTDEYGEFSSLQDFLNSGNYTEYLLPYELPERYKLKSINVEAYGEFKMTTILIESGSGQDTIIIKFPFSATQTTSANEAIGGRYTFDELKTCFEDPDYNLFSVFLSDHFSNLGLVGITGIKDEVIDLFSLSCRALGRNIDKEMLGYAKKCGTKWVRFSSTEKI